MRKLIGFACAFTLCSAAPAGAGPLEDIANALKQAEQVRKAAEAPRQGAQPVVPPSSTSQPATGELNPPVQLPRTTPPGSQRPVPCVEPQPARPNDFHLRLRNTCASTIMLINYSPQIHKCYWQSLKPGVVDQLYVSMDNIRAVCRYHSIEVQGSNCECTPGTEWTADAAAQTPLAAPPVAKSPTAPKTGFLCPRYDSAGKIHGKKRCDSP
jgi:hypothetical protein